MKKKTRPPPIGFRLTANEYDKLERIAVKTKHPAGRPWSPNEVARLLMRRGLRNRTVSEIVKGIWR